MIISVALGYFFTSSLTLSYASGLSASSINRLLMVPTSSITFEKPMSSGMTDTRKNLKSP